MEDIKVKIPSQEILRQKFEKYCLDEFYDTDELQPIYDLADQKKKPGEVINIIILMLKKHNIKIKHMEAACTDPSIHFMQGKELDTIHTEKFIKILLGATLPQNR